MTSIKKKIKSFLLDAIHGATGTAKSTEQQLDLVKKMDS